jgi:hypothetical protein
MTAVLLLAATPAAAATRTEILRDCQDGSLSGTYTAAELRDARDNLPADIDQYSDCRDVLSRALTGGGGGGGAGTAVPPAGGGGSATGGGGGGGGSGTAAGTVTGGAAGLGGAPAAPLTPTGPAEQGALDEAAKSAGSEPISVGEQRLVPGAGGFSAGAVRNALPDGLVVTLVLLAVAAAAAAASVLRRRVADRRPA